MREATKVAVRLLFFVGSYWPFASSDVKVPLMSWSFGRRGREEKEPSNFSPLVLKAQHLSNCWLK